MLDVDRDLFLLNHHFRLWIGIAPDKIVCVGERHHRLVSPAWVEVNAHGGRLALLILADLNVGEVVELDLRDVFSDEDIDTFFRVSIDLLDHRFLENIFCPLLVTIDNLRNLVTQEEVLVKLVVLDIVLKFLQALIGLCDQILGLLKLAFSLLLSFLELLFPLSRVLIVSLFH